MSELIRSMTIYHNMTDEEKTAHLGALRAARLERFRQRQVALAQQCQSK